jgi:hypothetical protein
MNISDDNRIVNGLWIGKTLSVLELLTIRSFLYNGHTFHLWVYDGFETPLPEGVRVMDANSIFAEDKIFRYKYKDQYGHGKGSLAGFSDIFRYKLLYEYGGWWVDMDVTCLKPLNFDDPYIFRPHHDMPVVGNVMKCPKSSSLMKYCYERASLEVDENNSDWHLPVQILNDGIEKFDLSKYTIDIANPESWTETLQLILKNVELPHHWSVIHWSNEEFRMNGLDKDHLRLKNTTLGVLIKKFQVPTGKTNLFKMLKNDINLARPFRSYYPFDLYSSPVVRIISWLNWIFHTFKKPFNKVYWFFHGHVKYYIDTYIRRKEKK